MAQRRGEATINNELDLRVWFRNDSDGTPFDPVEITKVEILDEDATTVLETIESGDINNLAAGNYQVITSDSWNTSAKVIYDKWYFRRIAAGVLYTSIQSTFIFTTTVSDAKYSTVTQFRNNVPLIDATVLSDNAVTDKITQADALIEQDLSKFVDFSSMPIITDDPATPDYINLLSQYKTAERCLVARYGAKRNVDEQSDRQYWERLYKELLDRIISGEIDVGDFGTGTMDFESNYRDGVKPALGMGEHGEHISESDLEIQREAYGGQED